MDILKVENLTKQFGTFTAVNDISFSLKEGEILGFLGPNGAGKTTTIHMLLGVLTPTKGSIFYFGKDLQVFKEEILEEVNFSSTYTNLPWVLTVYECLRFISFLYDIKDRPGRLAKVISMFKLENLLKKPIRDLSAGQQTRVNLAKAFINFPRVILLDEPTASLDVEVAANIREFLLNQRKEFATSIILTSHNMSEVEEMCDRVIIINSGKIVDDADPSDLAGKIKVSHIKLLVRDGLKRLTEYCEKNKLTFFSDERYITVDIEEKMIPQFLENLVKQGLVYEEMSIERPSLEDYFLQVAKQE